jgi:hypothetical protein
MRICFHPSFVLTLRHIDTVSTNSLVRADHPLPVHNGDYILYPFDLLHFICVGVERRLTCARAGYIGEFEIVDDHRSGKIVVQLNGRLNKTGVISPRYNVAARDIEPWVNLLLPARGFGIIILVSARPFRVRMRVRDAD